MATSSIGRHLTSWLAGLVLVSLAGCVGGLESPDSYPAPVALDFHRPDAGTAPETSGGCDIPTIFASCVACHDARGTFGGFDMQSAGWEARLVGGMPKGVTSASSCTGGGRVYLVPGSAPATGLFLEKLKASTTTCGDPMPLLADPLDAKALACVQQWANALTAPK
jgi:hypothetical protein